MERRIRIKRRDFFVGLGSAFAASAGTALAAALLNKKVWDRRILSPQSRQGVRVEVASSVSDFAPVPGAAITFQHIDQELATRYDGDFRVDPPSSGIRFTAERAQNGNMIPAFSIDTEDGTPKIWKQIESREPVVRVIEPNGKAGQWRQLRYEPDNRNQPAGIIIIRMQLVDQVISPGVKPSETPTSTPIPAVPIPKPSLI